MIGNIWGACCITALMETVLMGILFGFAEKRKLVDPELGNAFFVCLVTWAIGPIAVLIYSYIIYKLGILLIRGEKSNG